MNHAMFNALTHLVCDTDVIVTRRCLHIRERQCEHVCQHREQRLYAQNRLLFAQINIFSSIYNLYACESQE